MICGHGSRSKSAEKEFGLLAKGLKNKFPETPVEHGFLEYSAPNIHMGLDSLIVQGVEHIIAVPGMLFAATHAKNDIPSVLLTYQKKAPRFKNQLWQRACASFGNDHGISIKNIGMLRIRPYS